MDSQRNGWGVKKRGTHGRWPGFTTPARMATQPQPELASAPWRLAIGIKIYRLSSPGFDGVHFRNADYRQAPVTRRRVGAT